MHLFWSFRAPLFLSFQARARNPYSHSILIVKTTESGAPKLYAVRVERQAIEPALTEMMQRKKQR
jgi:hypothetical protein